MSKTVKNTGLEGRKSKKIEVWWGLGGLWGQCCIVGGILEASWEDFGGILGRSWVPKSDKFRLNSVLRMTSFFESFFLRF